MTIPPMLPLLHCFRALLITSCSLRFLNNLCSCFVAWKNIHVWRTKRSLLNSVMKRITRIYLSLFLIWWRLLYPTLTQNYMQLWRCIWIISLWKLIILLGWVISNASFLNNACFFVSYLCLQKERKAEDIPIVVHLLSPSMLSTAVKTKINRRRNVKNRRE